MSDGIRVNLKNRRILMRECVDRYNEDCYEVIFKRLGVGRREPRIVETRIFLTEEAIRAVYIGLIELGMRNKKTPTL